MKVMLATDIRPNQKLRFPCYVQPKLDGVRCYAKLHKQNGSLILGSRTRKLFSDDVLLHLVHALRYLPDNVVLDGELYVHGWSLHRILGAVNRGRPSDDSRQIEYHVFDCYLRDQRAANFEQRQDELNHLPLFKLRSPLQGVPTILVHSQQEYDVLYNRIRTLNYEGAIIREMPNHYELGVRSHQLIKHKEVEDDEFTITAILPGDDNEAAGKYQSTCGRIQLVTKDGVVFTAGSGITDKQRDELWAMRGKLKPTSYAKIVFRKYSDKGTPIEPRIKAYEL